MRNNHGITIVALVATVIILIVLASMTAITSIDAYNQMQYETFKAELEELQKAVDVLAEEYKMAYRLSIQYNYLYSGYGEFLSDYYGVNISKLDVSSISHSYKGLYNKYGSELAGGDIYLFTPDEIKSVFNIKGLEEDFIINFSTRRVYSAIGHKDPNGGNSLVYRLSDSSLSTNYAAPFNDSALNNAALYYAERAQEYIIDGTKMYEIILRIHYNEDPNDSISQKYDINKIEYNLNGKNTNTKIDNFEQYYIDTGSDIEKELKFIIYEAPENETDTIVFKVYDTEDISIETQPISSSEF